MGNEHSRQELAEATNNNSVLKPQVEQLILNLKAVENPPVYSIRISREIQEDTKTGEQDLIEDARQKLGIDMVRCYNFVFCGSTGTGKSSLVNALRGIADKADKGAKVGKPTRTTTGYQHPEYPHVYLWDVPGGNTQSYPRDKYFLKNQLFAFDCIIVVMANRVTDLDLQIAQDAFRYGTDVVFVRNHVDLSIEAKQQRVPTMSLDAAKLEMRTEVETKLKKELTEANCPMSPIFFVSSWAFNDQLVVQNDEVLLANFLLSTAQLRAAVPDQVWSPLEITLCGNCGSQFGSRHFVCLICDEYRHCDACERGGLHSCHAMLRISNPLTETENTHLANCRKHIVFLDSEKGVALTDKLSHSAIQCDGCKEIPIANHRYKCLTCFNFDLCGHCERFGTHNHHPMVRISCPNDEFSTMFVESWFILSHLQMPSWAMVLPLHKNAD